MREDFDRLQAQLKKRQERDNLAIEQQRYVLEEKQAKANALSTKGERAMEKVQRQKKRMEGQSYKQFKASIADVEDR